MQLAFHLPTYPLTSPVTPMRVTACLFLWQTDLEVGRAGRQADTERLATLPMQPGFMALVRPPAAPPTPHAADDTASSGGAEAAAVSAEPACSAPPAAQSGMIQFRLAKRDKKGRMEFRGLAVPEATKIGSRQATVIVLAVAPVAPFVTRPSF